MSLGEVVQGPIFGENAILRKNRNSEAKWTVIANGRSIANGTTIRRNGIVSVSIMTPERNDKGITVECEKNGADVEVCATREFEESENDVISLESASQKRKLRRPMFMINTSGTRTTNDALTSVIHQLRWRECKSSIKTGVSADLYWHGLGFEENAYNKPGVYAVNKLPGMFELAQKVHLSRIMKRMNLLFPGEFDFYPPTWFLPEQYHQFLAEVTMSNKSNRVKTTGIHPRSQSPYKKRKELSTYIVKPDTGSQGEGIYLVNDPRDVQETVGMKPAIIQKYIENPLLIEGYKFDLRLYVVVARLKPIEIYLCKDGLARLCTVEYEQPNSSNIYKTFMHLTNYSLNKYSDDFVHTNAEGTGSKRSYKSVKQLLKKRGHDVDKIQEQIDDLVVKTILSMLPDITIWEHLTNKSKLVRSFQILGFDVLLTSDMRAYLLEVNSSPSMCIYADQENEEGIAETVTSIVDEQIKIPLLRDALRLIAYGESEIDMDKSCLSRVYPPKREETTRSTKQEMSLSDGSISRQKLDIMNEIEALDKRMQEISLKSKCQGLIHHHDDVKHSRCFSGYDQPELDMPLTSRSMPAQTTISGFRHSSNNSLTSRYSKKPYRQHQAITRNSRFTVVKYKHDQPLRKSHWLTNSPGRELESHSRLAFLKDIGNSEEYAISTDEWRKIDHTKKSKLATYHQHRTAHSRLPSVDGQPPKKVQKRVEEDHLSDVVLFREIPKCGLCGRFINGVGPGLHYAQQEYKAFTGTQQEAGKLPEQRNQGSECDIQESTFEELENAAYEKAKYSLLRSLQFDEFTETRQVTDTKQTIFPATKTEELVCDDCCETASTSSDDVDSQFKSLNIKGVAEMHTGNYSGQRRRSFAMREVMLLNRAAAVFIYFNGIKPSLCISATAFRNMARRCRLCEQGAMPSIDILFIDTMRQWQVYTHNRSSPFYDSSRGRNVTVTHQPSGLPFEAFLEALFKLASSRFRGQSLKEKMEALVRNCELYIHEATRAGTKSKLKQFEIPAIERRTRYQYFSPRISGSQSKRRSFF